VVFAENLAYPLLECKFQPTTSMQDVLNTLIPLIQSDALDYDHEYHPNEPRKVDNLQ
jgi:hypothetical protein